MPERILRDWTDSEKFDGFAGSPEALFIRLIMKVDDYGRFTRDPINVRAACFPRAESLRANTVDAWLNELSSHRLILCYQVSGKWFLAIVNFRQRLRTSVSGGVTVYPKPKFPPMEGKPLEWRPDDGDWRELAASGGGSPPYADADAKALAESNAGSGARTYALYPPTEFPKKPLDRGSGGKAEPTAAQAWQSDDGTACPPCREIPDEEQALAMTMTANIDEKFVRFVYRQWHMQAGKNGNGVAVEWLPYVTGRWKNEQVEWRNGTHRGNKNSASRGVDRREMTETIKGKTI